jgi:ribonuclease P protein component
MEFREVGRRGQRSASGNLVLLVLEREGRCRLGITVSKRVGNAVVRNRIKRRIREWFRGSRPRLRSGVDVLVIARPPIRSLAASQLAEELERCAQELGLTADGAHP